MKMEFLGGSTTYEVGTATQEKAAPAALFLTEESSGIRLRRCVKSLSEEISEESSSSVVVSGESSENEEEEGDGVVSSRGTWFGSSLEDSLPIKRGLSNHYIGKSKSFGNLMEASKSKDLEKMESPLNKRRRLLIANKLRRRSSFSIYSKTNNNLSSMPLLALQESDEEDHKCSCDNDNDDSSDDDEISKLQEKRMKMTTNNRDFMVQAQSCFCLASFQDDDR
ncbi:hypothetical protein N665_1113s0013 [Sinapis alba]|nr:hypothetical protein N665_1113s0013 [Sinapis alba]